MRPFTIGSRLAFARELLAALAEANRSAAPPPWPGVTAGSRIDGLLSMIEREIWPRPRHPHRRLLEIAGWDPERLRRSLARVGVEATLARLANDGVYLRTEEVKGREPLVRRGIEIAFTPTDLDRTSGPAVPLGTSGTSGPVTHNPLDVAGFKLQASYKTAMLRALGAADLPVVLYYPAPSAAGIAQTIALALAGRPASAWFCHIPERSSSQARWGVWLRGLVLAARLRGVRLSLPVTAPIDNPAPLVAWLQRNAPKGAVVLSFPGSALRVQACVDAAGIALPPLVWVLGGEPVTPRKRRLLEARGHRVYPWYGAVDAGRIAIGCLAPEASDDMHLLADRFAAVVPPAPASLARRLLLTSVGAAVHKLLLNTDCGDTADLTAIPCGCAIESLGLPLRLRNVRTSRKLTLEGITLAADLVDVVADEVLPAACGGAPGDYQMLESEGNDGITRLIVRVDPALTADDDAIVHAVEEVLMRAAGGSRDTALKLRASGSIQVRRERPRLTGGGKLLGLAKDPSRPH